MTEETAAVSGWRSVAKSEGLLNYESRIIFQPAFFQKLSENLQKNTLQMALQRVILVLS